MKDLSGVLAAAAEVEAFCGREGWQFCFIGAIAVQRWGTPRFTQDVDLTLFTGLGEEERFVDELLQQFPGRLRDARGFALARRVLLARTQTGVDLDIALGALPFEEGSVARASPWHINDAISLTTCSAEDLIVHKVFAARDRDWSDVEGVLIRQHGKLDLQHIRKELQLLLELKDDLTPMARFEQTLRTVNGRLDAPSAE